MTAEVEIKLPEIMDIVAAEIFLEDLKQAINEKTQKVVLVTDSVERVTTPCFQIIVSAQKTLNDNGGILEIKDPSEVFSDSAALLGLSNELGLNGD